MSILITDSVHRPSPGADCHRGKLSSLQCQDPGGVRLVGAEGPGEAVLGEEVGRHRGVVTVGPVLPRPVGVADDVVVTFTVLPQ